MVKIKEIKKIKPKIKEIEDNTNTVKLQNLEEEIAESDTEDFAGFVGGRRRIASSTLAQNESPQEQPIGRPRIVAKEDQAEINFRPSYLGSGGNPYQGQKYSAMPERSGQSQAAGGTRDNMQTMRQDTNQSTEQARSAGRPEQEGGHEYAEGPKKRKDQNI